MEKKRPLGFETPSMRIQEEYKELLEQIMAKKADWEKILSHCFNMLNLASEMTNNFISRIDEKQVKHEQFMELEHRIINAGQSLTQLFIARIGKELADCDVRISAIEKALKELRSRTR